MAITPSVNSFNAGELTPYLHGRVELAKYSSGCKTLSNLIPMPYGGVRKRRGFAYVAPAKHDDKPCRLVRFQFAMDETFMLEFGEGYIRFFKNQAPLTVDDGAGNAVPYEVATPYTAAEVFELQWVQSLDVIFIAHANHPPCKLSRYAATDWRFEEVQFMQPPFLERNETDVWLHLEEDAETTALRLRSDSDLFQEGHAGACFALEHPRTDVSTVGGIGTSAGVPVRGSWNLGTSGTWNGVLYIERSYDREEKGSDDAATWESYRAYSSSSDRNIDVAGDEDDSCYLRVRTSEGFSFTETFRWELNLTEYYRRGIVRVQTVEDPRAALVEVLQKPLSYDPVKRWYEGAWSRVRGYPCATTFYQRRLFFGGSLYEPQTVWGSQVNDYENFKMGTLDTDALKYAFASEARDSIRWIAALEDVAVGTTGGEWRISATDTSNPLTPTNVKIVRQSTYGSGTVPAEVVNDVVIFPQRENRRLRELKYALQKDGYSAVDITQLSEHITGTGVVDTAFQQYPESILWCVRADGQMAALTYDSDQEVRAWSRHGTNGKILSAEVIASSVGDELWVAVERELPSGKRVYIERMQNENTAENVYWSESSDPEPAVAPVKIQIALLLDRDAPYVGDAAHGFGYASSWGVTHKTLMDAVEAAYPGMVEYALVSFRSAADGVNVVCDFAALETLYEKFATVEQAEASEAESNAFNAVVKAKGLSWDYRSSCLRVVLLSDYHNRNADTANSAMSKAANALRSMRAHGYFLANADIPDASNVESVLTRSDVVEWYDAYLVTVQSAIADVNAGASDSTGGFTTQFVAREVDFLDSALSYNGAWTSEVSGLEHLEGMTVGVVANGGYEGTRTVQDGKISLLNPAYDVRVGLPYTAELETLSIDLQGSIGSTQQRKIVAASFRFHRTGACKVGVSQLEPDPVSFRDSADPTDSPAPLFTGVIYKNLPSATAREQGIVVRSEDPEPLTLLCLTSEIES